MAGGLGGEDVAFFLAFEFMAQYGSRFERPLGNGGFSLSGLVDCCQNDTGPGRSVYTS